MQPMDCPSSFTVILFFKITLAYISHVQQEDFICMGECLLQSSQLTLSFPHRVGSFLHVVRTPEISSQQISSPQYGIINRGHHAVH